MTDSERMRDTKSNLLADFKNTGLVLCIGSGVTSQYVGTWPDLINKLFQNRYIDRYVSKNKELNEVALNYFKSLCFSKVDTLSPIEMGEYLLLDENDASSDIKDKLFRQAWREYYLASQIQAHIPEINSLLPNLSDNYNPSKNTLDAILTLCLSHRNGSNAIRHLITYNYDTLLEDCLKNNVYTEKALSTNSNLKVPMVTVFPNQKNSKPPLVENNHDNLYIYHVHGILSKGSAPIPVIFSESSYDVLSDHHYAWANQIQAELCMRYPLLFIGFSGHDPNFRRLLKALQRGNNIPYSYLFMKASDIEEMIPPTSKAEEKDLRLHAVDVLKESIEYYYKTMYKINILWYSNYAEISTVLMNLVNS